jgi:sulfur carrier protein
VKKDNVMVIVLNGKKLDVEAGATLGALLLQNDISTRTDGVAVAVNDAVVPRRQWAEVHLREGDAVEVIHAVQGG